MFRVVIGYIKEISLLRLMTTSDGMVRQVDSEEAHALERELVKLPKLTTTLLGKYFIQAITNKLVYLVTSLEFNKKIPDKKAF